MNSRSEGRVIVRKKKSVKFESTDDSVDATPSREHDRRIALIEDNQKNGMLRSRSDRIAGDFQHTRNFVVKELESLYPSMIWKRKVDRYYPLAEGGPLHIDEPGTIEQWIDLDAKALFMREIGLRYVALVPGGSEMDDMEALARCGQQTPTQ